MFLELFTWCPDKQTLLDGLTAYGFWPHPEVQISHIGPIPKITGTDPETGEPIITLVEGHHANLRCFGSLAEWFIEGKPQTDEGGNPLSIFERTKILDIIEGLEFVAIPSEGVPAGYRGPNGVVLIDPASVKTPYNVWA